MGAVKRKVYNVQLMKAVNYKDTNCLKFLLRSMDSLEKMGSAGDTVALSILIDLKTGLGLYKEKKTILNEKQVKVLYLTLVCGIPQKEVANMLGLTQHTISHHMNSGLKVLSVMLSEGEEDEG